LQTVLYAKAAAYILSQAGEVGRSEYLHIPIRETSGKLDFSKPDKAGPVMESALLAATTAVERVRQGLFPSAPGKMGQKSDACSDWCELSGLCRATRRSRWKAARYLEPSS